MKRWEPDKWKHFFVGIGAGAVLQLAAMYFFSFQFVFLVLIAFAALVIICYGFELFSLVTGKGHYELMDAIAGILGGMIGIAMIYFYTLI